MEFRMIPIDKIKPNPFQPRESFDKESLKELAVSIKDSSIIQPILVRKQGEGYQIIAGERRWRSAQMADAREIPCIVKDISEERVLLESLIENLHRKDLTDRERENAIHELWEKRDALGIKSRVELANSIGIGEDKVSENLDAWEFRQEEKTSMDVSTRVIRGTRGLEHEIRKNIIEKVKTEEIKASEVDTVAKIVRKATEPVRRELLKHKSPVTPRMAETIVEKLPSEEEQKTIIEEIKRQRLTEDEVEDRVREIQRAKELGISFKKEMGVHEGIIYTVGEYECPHCKKHYLIKCDGKKDWVE